MKLLLVFHLAVFLITPAVAQNDAPAQVGNKNESRKEKENEARETRPRKQDRVKATDPTVVTVEGRLENVEEDRGGSVGSKIGRGIRSAAGGTARALGRFGGWLLNIGDDIPSDRERANKEEQQRSGKR